MARKDVAGRLTAEELNHFREVVPGADAFVGEVVDAGIGVMRFRVKPGMTFVVVQNYDNRICQV